MGSVRVITLSCAVMLVTACANMNLSWDAGKTEEKDRKSLNLPSKPHENQQENEQMAIDVLKFYSNLLQIPAKERASQLSLAKARYEASPDLQRRFELVFAHLASDNKNKDKEVKKLVSDIDSANLLDNGQYEIYALFNLIKGRKTMVTKQVTNSQKLAELQSELDEREVEISKLQEQINALKNIEQSIHQRELGTISDGK